MQKKEVLSLTETSDFHLLLELMMPLYSEPEFTWLPELFSILGHEKLALLSKYAGGETIKIPTLQQLQDSINALNWYYDVFITHSKKYIQTPMKYRDLVQRIKKVYDAQASTSVPNN